MTDESELAAALADRYILERELGRGGMARVYLAHDRKHGRPVALKLLAPEIARTMGTERFEREIRLAARLQHPHICSVYDSGETAGRLWFTMPFVEGESLDVRLARSRPLPVSDALRIAKEAAQALAYAHEQGVVHRDVKPANLLLTRDGSTLVADFGIATAIGTARTAGEHSLTLTGTAAGTPAYMSPEQRAGVRDIDGRSDVYSLGLVLYEALAGQRPFEDGPAGMAAQFRATTLPSVRAGQPGIAPGVDELLSRALSIDPARRPTMAEFRDGLDRLISGTYQARPMLPSRQTRIGLAAGGVVLAAVITALLLRGGAGGAGGEPLSSAAVLPFTDQSPAHDQAYFSDGLTDELTTTLGRIPGLRVIARSSAFQFRGPDVDVREAGRRLGVGVLLQGTVRRSGNRLHVGVQLVNARDGYEIWSENYDRDLADVFQVQEEITRSIGAALSVRLGAGSDSALKRRPTRDLQAWDLYLQGRFAWNQRTATSLREAARYFNKAVARDTSLSQAWAGLASTGVLLPLYSAGTPDSAWRFAKAAALRAIALDSSSAEAYTALAYGTMLYEWNWAKAEDAFKRAIAVDSTYSTAWHWYADYFAGRDRMPEALVAMQRAQALDPLSRIIPGELGWILGALHRTREADSVLAETLRLDPSYAQTHFIIGLLRLSEHRPAEAIESMRRSLTLGGAYPHAQGALVAALAANGDRAGAEAELRKMLLQRRSDYVPPFAFVAAYAGLGDLDQAFAWLDRGLAERDVLLPENFFEPLMDPLKQDPRYASRAARIRN